MVQYASCSPDLPTSDSHGRDQERDAKSAPLVETNAPVYGFVGFLRAHITARHWQSGGVGHVVEKIDVEGAEWEIFGRRMKEVDADPTFARVVEDFVVEYHGHHAGLSDIEYESIKLAWNQTTALRKNVLDGESFSRDPFLLPPRVPHETSEVSDPWSTKTILKDGAFWRKPGFQHETRNQHYGHVWNPSRRRNRRK